MTLEEVYADAEASFAAEQYGDALRAYFRIIEAVPSFLPARKRVGDALLEMEAAQAAESVYVAVARRYIEQGHPLLGLAVIKRLTSPISETLMNTVAELYSATSDRVANIPVPPMPDLPHASLIDEASIGQGSCG
ncbi:MAG: hypothetical protein AAF449_25590 [Myxococcota bacterium]